MAIKITQSCDKNLVPLFKLHIGATFMLNGNLHILSRAKQDESTVQALNLSRNGALFSLKPTDEVLPVDITIEIEVKP